MSGSGDTVILYPTSLEEACSFKEKHPEAIIKSACLSAFLLDFNSVNSAYIIDLKDINELNFFMEDHGYWFIGTSYPEEELSASIKNRIPDLESITLQSHDNQRETFRTWLINHKASLHHETANGMKVIPVDDLTKEVMISGIACMISIPK